MTKNNTKCILCMNEEKGITLVSNGDYINALVNGKLYNTFNFRPLGGNGRQLREDSQNAIREMLPAAREALEKMKAEQPTTPAAPVTPAETPRQNTPYDLFMDSMMTVLSDKIGAEMVKTLFPVLEKKFIEEFGLIPKVHEIRIPEREPYKTTEVLHKDFNLLVSMTLDNEAAYLCGPAGTGKSYMAKQLAAALNLEYYYTNSVTDDIQLKGFVDANGKYHETQFYKAFTNGGVFLLDELDASVPETLNLLNNALANGYFDFPIGRTDAHKDFHCIAAGNTYGTGADNVYTGRYQLDAATMNRFSMVTIDYDREIEMAMANGDSVLVDFANDFRKAVEKCGTTCLCTYRDIKRLAKFTAYMEKHDALRIGLVKGLSKDDIRTIYNNMESANEWRNALRKLF